MSRWLDRDEALDRLGVKQQTLYAYVSRKLVRAEPHPDDSRRSVYDADDVAELLARRARGRRPSAIAASSMALGEPTLPTDITVIGHGTLSYRGHDVIELARTATLESTAALLWESPTDARFVTGNRRRGAAGMTAGASRGATEIFASLSTALASMMGRGEPILGRSATVLAGDAAQLVGLIAAVCGAGPGGDPVHVRLAEGWGRPAAAAKIGQALVVMADHDLTPSTFAARVAASTGASMAACVLAGVCALSGPRHGAATSMLQEMLEDSERDGLDRTLGRWLDLGLELPGFGHPLYPNGDPRGALLMDSLPADEPLQTFSQAVGHRTGHRPNSDFGLVAMSRAFDLPPDAPMRLFVIGRAVGWCAHAMEQNRVGTIIRPRGRHGG